MANRETTESPPMRSKLVLIGYWLGPDAPGWPDPTGFVDTSWNEDERKAVTQYLHRGVQAPWQDMGPSRCRLCGMLNGTQELMNGTFLWPEGLAHYLEEHSVRLPRRIVDQMLHGNAELPTWVVDPSIVDWDRGDFGALMDELVDRSWWKTQAAKPATKERRENST